MRLITLCLVLLLVQDLSAASWYLSNDGDDNHSGDSPENAWRSIAQLNAKLADGTIQSGDQILFHPGHVFEGQISFDNRLDQLFFSTWDSGKGLATIKGSQVLSEWVPSEQQGIWSAPLATRPSALYLNGQLQTPARYPNSGWLYLSASSDRSHSWIGELAIERSGIYWGDGGQVVIRTEDWKYETRNIALQIDSTLIYSPTDYEPEPGRNYFLLGKLEALDTLGEWSYHEAEGRIYFKPPEGLDPNTLRLEAALYPHGIKGDWNRSEIRIESLYFIHQTAEAIWLGGIGSGNSIQHCIFRDCHTGIYGMGANLSVQNNQFRDCYHIGLRTEQLTGTSVIHGNTFHRIGLNPWASGNGAMSDISSIGTIIRENVIDSCGSVGISIAGSSDFLIEKNIVQHAMMILSDGGGIYTCCGTERGIIQSNFVSKTLGDLNGSPGGTANGIYIDNHSSYMLVQNNTISDVPTDGLIGNAATHDLTFRGNTTYNCGAGLSFEDWKEEEPIYNCRASNNVLFALEENQYPLQVLSLWDRYEVGSFDSNYYYNPFDFYVVNRSSFWIYPRYTLKQWQEMYPQDQHSQQFWTPALRHPLQDSSGVELVLNGSYDLDIGGWSCWSDRAFCTVDWIETQEDLSPGTLIHTFAEDATQSLIASPILNLEAGQWYRLRLQLKSQLPLDVEIQLKQGYGDFGHLQTINWLPLDHTAQRSFQLVFQSQVSEPEAQLVLVSENPKSAIWVDNVSLQAVTIQDWPVKSYYRLYENPSNTPLEIPLDAPYVDINQEPLTGTLTLAPWTSQLLIRTDPRLITSSRVPRGSSAIRPVSLFPNPAAEWVQVETETSTLQTVRVRDVAGRVLLEKQLNHSVRGAFQIDHLPPGVYVVEITLRNGLKQVDKLIKK